MRTGAHTTSIPGLWAIGEMALAEKLNWSRHKFRRAFCQLKDRGMVEADWRSGVVYVPAVLQVDSPANPDVVRGWRDSWHEIPACALKAAVCARLREHCAGRGANFLSAFNEVVGGAASETGHRVTHAVQDFVSHGGGAVTSIRSRIRIRRLRLRRWTSRGCLELTSMISPSGFRGNQRQHTPRSTMSYGGSMKRAAMRAGTMVAMAR